MLQFWKKSAIGRKRGNSLQSSSRSDSTESSTSQQLVNGTNHFDGSTDPGCVGPLRGFCDDDIGDLGASDDNKQKQKSSKLSKTLDEVLADKGALGYFIQYMEARQKIGYIKFWLDCESFCAATKCLKLDHANTGAVNWAVTKDILENCSDTASVTSTEDGSLAEKLETCVEHDSQSVNDISSRAESLFKDSLMDAVKIYRKYLSKSSSRSQVVQVPEEMHCTIVDQICREDGQVDSSCFVAAQEHVYDIMEKQYYNDFLRSDFHCKHQIDVLTSGNVTLCDILFNDTALFHFAEFMEQEGNQSLLEFWLAATNFHQQLLEKVGAYDTTEAQNDAIVLYDKYFSLQATCPLGFSDKVRFEVEQNICREEGPLPDCFAQSANIVLHVLDKNYFQPFLSSQLYLKYLSELINTIQSSHSLLGRRRSDCSSNHSLSSLAAQSEDSFSQRKVIHNIDEREMSIDSRQLYDPDSLWRRRHQSGLSVGRINELGRFETDFEPEPDRKGESRLSRVVKKFVNLEEDKAKEEMAWQIAAMIVKDVTSITLGTQDKKPSVSSISSNSGQKQPSGS